MSRPGGGTESAPGGQKIAELTRLLPPIAAHKRAAIDSFSSDFDAVQRLDAAECRTFRQTQRLRRIRFDQVDHEDLLENGCCPDGRLLARDGTMTRSCESAPISRRKWNLPEEGSGKPARRVVLMRHDDDLSESTILLSIKRVSSNPAVACRGLPKLLKLIPGYLRVPSRA